METKVLKAPLADWSLGTPDPTGTGRSRKRTRSLARAFVFAVGIAVAALGACNANDSEVAPEATPEATAGSWASQRMPSGFQELVESQPRCRECLAFERLAVIGGDRGPGILPYSWQRGVVDRHGNYWAGQPGTVKVYDPHGTFLRDVGRGGQGPLEFLYARPIFIDSEGNVHIYDNGNARETIVGSDFRLVDTRPMFRASDEMAPLPAGRYVTAKWIETPDRIGYPLHVIEGLEIVRSFGIPADAESEPLTRFTAARLVTTDPVGHILSSERYRYLIEAWTTDGIRIMGLRGPRLNDREIQPTGWSLDANPPPLGIIVAVQGYGGDRLWVIWLQRRENWRDAARETILPNGRVVLDTVDGTLSGFYESRIDVIDLNTATLIASGTHDGILLQFLDGYRVVESYPTEDGDWRVAIWRVGLLRK